MSSSDSYILDIRDSSNDIALVGGKGANLGELARAGQAVPTAFIVTTKAYKVFIAHNRLQQLIVDSLLNADYGDVVDLATRASRIRDAFLAGEIPAEVVSEIDRSYGQLGAGTSVAVSVRSSATAEDLPGTSFAGQQDTYLHILGAHSVVEHVRRCWASLWTDRAIAYRERQGFRHIEVSLAVVIQEMFPSDISGVMFTVNPVTSNPKQIFINSSWGLGEAVVSGRVNPDQYIVDKGSLVLIERKLQDKKVMTAPSRDGLGTEEVPVPDDMRLEDSLGETRLRELAAIGQKIESHYGYPQDIEWGYANGRFAILQAREVTAADIDFAEGLEAFQTPEARNDLLNERWTWSRGWSDEVQTGPSTPWWYTYQNSNMTHMRNQMLEFTDTEEFLGFDKSEFKNIPIFRWYGARAYVNLAVEKERIRRFIPPFARDDAALWLFPAEEREAIRNMAFNWPRFLTTLWNIHLRRPQVSLLESHQVAFENLAGWKTHEEKVWREVDLETASARQLIDLQVNLRIDTGFAANVCLPFSIYIYVLPAALKLLCRDWLDDAEGAIYSTLLTGLASKTSEENMAVWQLAQTLRKSSVLRDIVMLDQPLDVILARLRSAPEGAEFDALMTQFIKDYGHRGGAERDPVHPRYRHQPHNVLVPVRSMMSLDESASPAVKEHKNSELMREARDAASRTLRQGPLGFLRAPFFSWFLQLVQQWMYYRDFERFYNDKTMSRPRDWLIALGRRFVKRGLLSDAEDIFFLGKEEIMLADEGALSAQDIGHRVRSRRRVYSRYGHREPPKYIRGWHMFDDARLDDGVGGLQGLPASRGVVTGRARVCRRLAEIGKVQKGDILVTVATDPGWTTVFSFIGGVVVETGGVVAHAVMISREYGLPCVANLENACDRIPDGAIITLDGTTGRVVIHQDRKEG